QRADLHSGPGATGRFCVYQGVERRPLGQLGLSQNGAELQSSDGYGSGPCDRGGGGNCRPRRARSELRSYARDLRRREFRGRESRETDRASHRPQAYLAAKRLSGVVSAVGSRRYRAQGRTAMSAAADKRELIARRVAQELRDGDYVNLGIGLPTLISNYLA